MPRYAGRINCIYIDPPYNTGNENWRYNDNVNSPMMQEWLKGKSPVDGEDLERHDKWMCMMWPRLQLLKELLDEKGVIYVSIDDNEQHHLRMLMDEVFGSQNFVNTIIWQKKSGGGQDSEYLAREHEYIHVYCKSKNFRFNFRKRIVLETEYTKIKNKRRCKFIRLEKWGAGALRTDRPTLYFAIKSPDGDDIFPIAPSGREGRWRTNPTALSKDHIHWEKKNNRWVPYEVRYFDEEKKEKIIKDRTIFYDFAYTTEATNEQVSIFGQKELDNSKPMLLLRRLIQIAAKPQETIVLDSFAGSGTTAHAVLQLNSEDKGNRKFILVECEDYADTITAGRVRRIMKGISKSNDSDLKKGFGGNFAYCILKDEISIEKILDGNNLPDYDTLALHLYWKSTGQPLTKVRKPRARGRDGLFFETKEHLYYLIYEKKLDFLRSHNSALNITRAKRIEKKCKAKNKEAIVFASHKFVGQKELSQMRITFCGLPYCLA